MLRKEQIIIEYLLEDALREQTQICQWHMMLMHKHKCQFVKKINIHIPKWL